MMPEPELTNEELRRLRDRGSSEEDGLLLAAVEEILWLRAEVARLCAAADRLLAASGTKD